MCSFNLGSINFALHTALPAIEEFKYIKKGVLAKSNAELVGKVVQLAEILNRHVAAPGDARKILGLKGLDRVGF